MKSIKIFVYVGVLFFVLAKPAYAYLDPANASYLFQIVIAGAIGSVFFMKDIVRKIKEIFKGNEKKEIEASNE